MKRITTLVMSLALYIGCGLPEQNDSNEAQMIAQISQEVSENTVPGALLHNQAHIGTRINTPIEDGPSLNYSSLTAPTQTQPCTLKKDSDLARPTKQSELEETFLNTACGLSILRDSPDGSGHITNFAVKNCHDVSVRRRVEIAGGPDLDCFEYNPGQTRTFTHRFPSGQYVRSLKAC